MLLGFLAATFSISLGFVVSFAIMRGVLGEGAWKSLGALCGSWMGGGGNMLAIQAALDIGESAMAYALVMDSICGTLYIMFLLWAIAFPTSSTAGRRRILLRYTPSEPPSSRNTQMIPARSHGRTF